MAQRGFFLNSDAAAWFEPRSIELPQTLTFRTLYRLSCSAEAVETLLDKYSQSSRGRKSSRINFFWRTENWIGFGETVSDLKPRSKCTTCTLDGRSKNRNVANSDWRLRPSFRASRWAQAFAFQGFVFRAKMAIVKWQQPFLSAAIRPKTKELLKLFFLFLFTIWFISSLKGI